MARRLTVIGDEVIPSVGKSYTDKATVRAVQQALKAKGIDPGPIDGIYGPKTSAGVKAMQATIGSAQTGQIDYGVLMALGVSAPSAAQVAQAMTDAAAVSSATAKSHESGGSDAPPSPEVQAAQAQVKAAKAKVASAVTPQAAQAAQVQLSVAEQHLDAVAPTSFFMRPVLGRPLWQVSLFAIGGLAFTAGLVTLLSGKKRK